MSLLQRSFLRNGRTSANSLPRVTTSPTVGRIPFRSSFRQYASGTTPLPNHRPRRVVSALAALGIISGAYSLGVVFPPNLYTLIFPREAPPSAKDGSPEAQKEMLRIESELWSIPIVQKLAASSYPINTDNVPKEFLGPAHIASRNSDVNVGEVNQKMTHYMSRPYVNIPDAQRRHSLTAGLLQGPGRMVIPPLLFVRVDEKAMTGVIHLGRSICGHDGIVHGGAIATLFDDSLFRTAVASFPATIGVTAWIRIDYKAPTRADQFVVLNSKVDKVEGRKVFVSGQIEDLEGTVLAKAEALFVQPKYAHLLKNEERDQHFLGRPAAIIRTLEPVAENSDMK